MKYVSFPLPENLRLRCEEVAAKMLASDNKKQYVNEFWGCVEDVSDAGLKFFFVDILKKAKVGMLTLAGIEMAISTGKRAVLTVGKKIVNGMNDEQLGTLAEFMQDIIIEKKES